MRYVRPYDATAVQPGTAGPWLISSEEELGVALRLRRGGAPSTYDGGDDLFVVLLEGTLSVSHGGGTREARPGNVTFVPASGTTTLEGDAGTVWIEVTAPVPAGAAGGASRHGSFEVVEVDEARFKGDGFAYQTLLNREAGSNALCMNLMQVQPGAGSPDFHIHAFAQIYLIEEGEMTVDIGVRQYQAPAPCVVVLPAGVTHRNYNASGRIERHTSLLVPEPQRGEIFDYAVTIHECEADMLKGVPARPFVAAA